MWNAENITNRDIEKTAVRKIEDMLEKNRFIHTDIKVGDKKISYDGFIEIYNGKSDKKDNFMCEVRVQVKGKIVDKLTADDKTEFKISVNDLHVYKKQKEGTLYFIVELLKEETDKYNIFYVFIEPNIIKNKLNLNNNTGKYKQIRFEFNKLTYEDACNFHIKINNFHIGYNSQKNLPVKSINEVICVESIIGEHDIFSSKFNEIDYYNIIFKDKNDSKFVLNSGKLQLEHLEQNIDIKLTCEDRNTIVKSKIITTKNKIIMECGCISIEETIEDKTHNLIFKINKNCNLDKFVKYAEFILDVYCLKKPIEIQIGYNKYNYNIPEVDNEFILYFKENLENYRRIKEILELMNVKTSINICEINANDLKALNSVYGIGISKTKSGFWYENIFDTDILLYKDNIDLNIYNLNNIKIYKKRINVKNSITNEIININPLIYLLYIKNGDEFKKIVRRINFDFFKEAILDIQDTAMYFDLMTLLSRKILGLFLEDKDRIFIDLNIIIYEKIMEVFTSEYYTEHINTLKLIYYVFLTKNRILNIEEKLFIEETAKVSNQDEFVKLLCYKLLNNDYDVEKIVNTLSKTEICDFKLLNFDKLIDLEIDKYFY